MPLRIDSASTPIVYFDGAVLLVLLGAAVLTLPLALLILRRYRQAVARAMRSRGVEAEAEALRGGPDAERAGPAAPPLRLSGELQAPDPRSSPAAWSLYQRLKRSRWQAALAYLWAGTAYVVPMTVLYLLATGDFGFYPHLLLVVSLTFAWPAVLAVVMVAVANRRWKVAGPLCYGVAVALVAGLPFLGSALVLLLMFNAAPTLFLLALSARPIRTAGPLVFVVVAAALVGAQLSLYAAYGTFLALGLDVGVLPRVVQLITFAALAALGVLSIRGLAGAYARRRVSDQLLLVGVWWLLFALWMVLLLAQSWGARGALGLVPFAASMVVLVGVLRRVRRTTTAHPPVRLLLLRVFGSRARSARLFREVGLYWRYVGPVRLIAGTDLATEMAEPHELLTFLSGRLLQLFVADAEDLERRLATLDDRPDPDGRYRVEDLFCHDDTWRAVVARLVDESDAVLVDLRGFRAENRGVAHELAHLIGVMPAGRIVLVEDATTDAEGVRAMLAQAWAGMGAASPNRAGAEALTLIPLGQQGVRDIGRLLAQLCVAATTERRPATGTRAGILDFP